MCVAGLAALHQDTCAVNIHTKAVCAAWLGCGGGGCQQLAGDDEAVGLGQVVEALRQGQLLLQGVLQVGDAAKELVVAIYDEVAVLHAVVDVGGVEELGYIEAEAGHGAAEAEDRLAGAA